MSTVWGGKRGSITNRSQSLTATSAVGGSLSAIRVSAMAQSRTAVRGERGDAATRPGCSTEQAIAPTKFRRVKSNLDFAPIVFHLLISNEGLPERQARNPKLLAGRDRLPALTMIEAEIAFLVPCARRPVFHDTPSNEDFLPLKQYVVSISAVHDERMAFRLDRHGVEIVRRPGLLEHRPSGEDRAAYLRALEDTIAKVTGASRVISLGNGVVRRSERSTRHRRDGTTVLGRFAHCDFSPAPAGSTFWVEHLLPADEARERLARRYVIYNVWQCLTEPPQDTPLSFCDPASIAPDDLVGCDQVILTGDGKAICFELSLCHHNPGQRWFYFPNLHSDELLVFKGYDSDPDQPQGIVHAAFTDPSCPAGALPRESIDERLIAFFD